MTTLTYLTTPVVAKESLDQEKTLVALHLLGVEEQILKLLLLVTILPVLQLVIIILMTTIILMVKYWVKLNRST